MDKHTAYQTGYDNGYSIGAGMVTDDCQPFDGKDEFVEKVMECEENARQFSPFEFFVSDIAKSQERFKNGEGLWDAYDRGVREGAEEAYQDFVVNMEV